jgi:hypothetical protein
VWADGGAKEAAAHAAAWATSPQVTAAQADDLITVAAAAHAGALDSLFDSQGSAAGPAADTPPPDPATGGAESTESVRERLWERARAAGSRDAKLPTPAPAPPSTREQLWQRARDAGMKDINSGDGGGAPSPGSEG